MSKEWFSSWFNTPYYHTLYKNRDDNEAKHFLDKLIDFLQPSQEDILLDLACGKGRHSIYLNQKGFKVEGCDLSSQSIAHANGFRNDSLQFFEHDMRNRLPKRYNYIFNLFTSFGYFNELSENLKVLNSVSGALIPNGILVIDFMNASKVISNLAQDEEKTVDGLTFRIKRRVENDIIVKSISFNVDGEPHQYEERVQALKLEQFKSMLSKVGLIIDNIFGDYDLNPFDINSSDRLIIVAKKNDKL